MASVSSVATVVDIGRAANQTQCLSTPGDIAEPGALTEQDAEAEPGPVAEQGAEAGPGAMADQGIEVAPGTVTQPGG